MLLQDIMLEYQKIIETKHKKVSSEASSMCVYSCGHTYEDFQALFGFFLIGQLFSIAIGENVT